MIFSLSVDQARGLYNSLDLINMKPESNPGLPLGTRTLSILLKVFIFCPLTCLMAQMATTPPAEPQVVSIFPIGGQQASSFDVEIRGQSLEGAYAVWFDCEALKGEVKKIEELDLDEAKPEEPKDKIMRRGHRVLVGVRVDSSAKLGAHTLRLVSLRGISNSLTLRVYSDPVIAETVTPHHLPGEAMPVPSFPVVVNGKISRLGEVDFYAFDALRDQELLFEVFSGSGVLDPHLTLYEPAGSWFDSHRPNRLAFDDDSTVQKKKTTNPRLTYRFTKRGRHIVGVGSFDGRGGPDYAYQLRVVSLTSISSGSEKGFTPALAHGEPQDWRERDFGRNIDSERLQTIWSRTVRVSNEDKAMPVKGTAASLASNGGTDAGSLAIVDLSTPARVLDSVVEKEPNDTPSQALEIIVPTVIGGAIQRPGDVDFFRVKVKSGDQLAFEIETPDTVPPNFNPRLAISDADGQEVLTNIHRTIQSKTIYPFEQGGEYSLQVRDLTSRYGAPNFTYRVLVRPQIAHVGEIKVNEDRINLIRGEAKKLTVITEQEEGFDGEIALMIENLPQGVESFPATEVEPDRPPPLPDAKRLWFVPKRQTATIMLLASTDAPATALPQFARVSARPIVQGKPGIPVSVREIPLMVVAKPERVKGE